MSILGDITKVAGGVVGNMIAPGVGGALGSALGGEVGDKLGDLAGGSLGDITKLPLAGLAGNATKLLDPWSDIASVLRGGCKVGDDLKFHGVDDKAGCTKPGGTGGASGGGSIFEKIFAILQKLQDELNKKVGELDGLDPKNDKAALDKGLFEVQQLQQQMTQLTSMATNLSSADHNSKKGIVDNFNIR
jgi:hypothetical protein